MTAFISYSGGRHTRLELVYALREHGVTPWRDVEDLDVGDQTTETIEEELARCSGVILWITDRLFGSAYVTEVELPAIARAARSRGLRIVPVFDGMGPSEAADRISAFGVEIGESNGHVVHPRASVTRTASEVASRYVRGEVRAAVRSRRLPVVRLVSYDDTAPHREDAVLNFDWRHRLDAPMGADTEQRLKRALDASTRALKAAFGGCEILLAIKAHLPLAVALGQAFAEPTGCTLRMERGEQVLTLSRDDVQPIDRLQELSHLRGPVTAGAAAVEVAVTRSTEAGVTAYVAEGHRYRERVEFVPASGPGRDAMSGLAQCGAWARQVGDRVSDLGTRYRHVDLFLACPVELAVGIGWWTNAAGPVNILNWEGKTGPYTPMWHLS